MEKLREQRRRDQEELEKRRSSRMAGVGAVVGGLIGATVGGLVGLLTGSLFCREE